MNSNDEFLKALAMLEPLPEVVLEYRIHYDDQGSITRCSMTDHPIDTNYIVATKDQYDHYYQYNIVNGKLKKIDMLPKYRVQLKKSNSGYKVVKNHAGLLLEPDETFGETEYYDRTNN